MQLSRNNTFHSCYDTHALDAEGRFEITAAYTCSRKEILPKIP